MYSAPVKRKRLRASGWEVSGPLATMTGPSAGISSSSSRMISTSGSSSRARVISPAKRSRSTASASPAGTAVRSAERMMSESSRRSSSFRTPCARWGLLLLSELLQTSSARRPVLCAGGIFSGRISYRRTGTPRRAACQAASEPASPPPIMVMGLVKATPRGKGFPRAEPVRPLRQWHPTSQLSQGLCPAVEPDVRECDNHPSATGWEAPIE